MTDPSDRWQEIHARAIKRFNAIWAVQKDERAESLDDRRFYSIRGAQWDDAWGAQFENAPKMEVNKTHKEVVRILSDYRNNRVSVDFRPSDDSTDDDTADTLDGLYRADFEASGGQEAVDNAFEEKVGGGMGAWRLRAAYEDDSDPDNDYQRICFEPITDADQRVFFDLDARRQDKSDAKYGFVLTPMSPEAFEEEYDEGVPSDFATTEGTFEWFQAVVVNLAEYYEVDEKTSVKVTLERTVIEPEEQVLIDPDAQTITDLEAEGWKVARRRKIKTPKVIKFVMSGQGILSEETIAGPNIPVVVDYGKRWYVENIERCAGHVRYAKDPQRIYNAEVSQLAEIASLSPIEKPIFDPEQVAGLEDQWARSNIDRHPYALAHALRDENGGIAHMGPIGSVTPPGVAPALAALVQLAGADIAEMTGANDQAEEVPANTSAQAIELVHTRADAKTFIYIDNHKKAVKRCGQIWKGMAGELYVEEGRKMLALDQQGGQKYATLHEPALAQDGAQIVRNDFSKAKCEVIVDVGPSSTTRRDATVRSMVGMASAAQGDPELSNVLISTALMNMDGEGIDDVQKWIRGRLLRQGVVKPTEQELAELQAEAQNQPPDPQAALAAGMTQQALAEADKARAGAIKTVAETEKVQAQIQEILAGVSRADRDQIIEAIKVAGESLARTVPMPVNGTIPSLQ